MDSCNDQSVITIPLPKDTQSTFDISLLDDIVRQNDGKPFLSTKHAHAWLLREGHADCWVYLCQTREMQVGEQTFWYEQSCWMQPRRDKSLPIGKPAVRTHVRPGDTVVFLKDETRGDE